MYAPGNPSGAHPVPEDAERLHRLRAQGAFLLEQRFNERVVNKEITVRRSRSASARPGARPETQGDRGRAQTNIFESTTIYVVKKGDTLPNIAARHEIYNDSTWPLIYKANRDQIKDPKVVYGPGPEDPQGHHLRNSREAGAPEPEKIPKETYAPKRKKWYGQVGRARNSSTTPGQLRVGYRDTDQGNYFHSLHRGPQDRLRHADRSSLRTTYSSDTTFAAGNSP